MPAQTFTRLGQAAFKAHEGVDAPGGALAVVYEVGFPDLPQQVGRTEDDGDGDD